LIEPEELLMVDDVAFPLEQNMQARNMNRNGIFTASLEGADRAIHD